MMIDVSKWLTIVIKVLRFGLVVKRRSRSMYSCSTPSPVSTAMGNRLRADELSRYVTNYPGWPSFHRYVQ